MCHLKPYAEKKQNREESDISEHFASLAKAVDKFHFPGPKTTDKFCRENCNPILEIKKLGIEVTNTPACEQAFKWINAFKNLKGMNEAHYKFFLMYLIDLHNLHIQNKVSSVANPLNESRDVEELLIGIETLDLEGLKIVPENKQEEIQKKELGEQRMMLEDCYRLNEEILHCKLCPGQYKREGHMKNHVESKHNIQVDLICKCGQTFTETTRYCRHRKGCNKIK